MTGQRRVLVAAGLGALLADLGVWAVYREGPAPTVRVPELSAADQAGRAAGQRSCASCHGDVAQGTATGPPLVHAIIARDIMRTRLSSWPCAEGRGPPLALRGHAAAADGHGGRDPHDYALRPGTPASQRDRLTGDKVGATRLTIGVIGSSGGT
jgi:hypothetical protein